MKTFLLFAAMAFSVSIASGQEYLISYTGSGQSSTVASVLVVNLSSGDSLLMNGSDTLFLTSTVGIRSFGSNNEVLSIYPNPVGRTGRIDFYSSRPGNTSVEVFELTGKCILQQQEKLAGGSHSYEIGGLKSGIYFVKVSTSENLLTGRFIATGTNGSNPFINHTGHSNDAGSTDRLKSAKSIVEMYFIEGDRLLFKGISGNYARVLTLVPVESTTIDFNFVECQDTDNNHYPVVSIGNKDWMAENLKTTTYNDGTPIGYPGAEVSLWEEDTVGAYAWWDNNPLWKDKYGALYNWYAVKNEKEICPDGWQLPNDTLWALLAYNLGGEILGGGKIKSTRTEPNPHPRWKSPNVSSTNESGFSALPASYRFNFGTYGELCSNTAWWSSSENTDDDAWYRSLNYYDGVFLRSSGHKNSGYAVRCIKAEDAQVTLPTLTTYEIYNITAIFGMTGGNITNDGGAPVTARGVCWSTNPNPSTADFYTIDGEGTGSFISSMHDLMHGTTYYVRAYAINITGTAYGNEQQFTTPGAPCPDAPTVTDIDGNVYNTVQIGTQCWMKENLKTTKYRNGVSIDYPGDNVSAWTQNSTGAYAWYNNDISWKHIYGTLYNGYAVRNSYGICPEGWHVPSNNNWNTLINYTTGGFSTGGSQLKSCRQINSPIGYSCDTDEHPRWAENNTYFGIENYGFSVLPGGYRHESATYGYISNRGWFWSSTVSGYKNDSYYFRSDSNAVYDDDWIDLNNGFSIRCVKDQ